MKLDDGGREETGEEEMVMVDGGEDGGESTSVEPEHLLLTRTTMMTVFQQFLRKLKQNLTQLVMMVKLMRHRKLPTRNTLFWSTQTNLFY